MNANKLIESRTEFIRKNRTLINNDAPLITDAFDAAWEAVMRLPLSERLTDVERESIVFAYKASVRLIAETTNPYMAEVFKGQQQLLISIFVSDLFNDKNE